MARRITASVYIEGFDHETLGSNETASKTATNSITLDVADQPMGLLTTELRWGGECRVEVRLTVHLTAAGRAQVSINGKLFEGDSESTNDLDDEENTGILVGKGRVESFSMLLENEGAGDKADVTGTVSNTLVEDDAG